MAQKQQLPTELQTLAIQIGREVWKLANSWEGLPKMTLGKSMVQKADRIASYLSNCSVKSQPTKIRNLIVAARSSAQALNHDLDIAYERLLISNFDFEHLKGSNEKIILILDELVIQESDTLEVSDS